MCRIDRIVQNLIIFPDFILHILSINVNRISDDPLIISIFQKEICHAPCRVYGAGLILQAEMHVICSASNNI